jgi:hypothetical protein
MNSLTVSPKPSDSLQTWTFALPSIFTKSLSCLHQTLIMSFPPGPLRSQNNRMVGLVSVVLHFPSSSSYARRHPQTIYNPSDQAIYSTPSPPLFSSLLLSLPQTVRPKTHKLSIQSTALLHKCNRPTPVPHGRITSVCIVRTPPYPTPDSTQNTPKTSQNKTSQYKQETDMQKRIGDALSIQPSSIQARSYLRNSIPLLQALSTPNISGTLRTACCLRPIIPYSLLVLLVPTSSSTSIS